eukprot:COSAG06_NODE_13685_length_1231_cov_1742.634276_1_plen_96_part_10
MIVFVAKTGSGRTNTRDVLKQTRVCGNADHSQTNGGFCLWFLRAQEAEFLLTQSWDRRPQHVAALLLPHQSAGGSGVLGWALEAPQLPLLCASPWF